jgi:hypothetical protein
VAKRVIIVGQLDGFANSVRPRAIQRFLESRGHAVELVDTYRLSRLAKSGRVRSHLPRPGVRRLLLYAIECAGFATRRSRALRRRASYHLLLADYAVRRSLLRSLLPLDAVDLIISVTPYDAGVLTVAATRTLYDCPTPRADELNFDGLLTPKQHLQMRKLELALYRAVDHLAFHWESYARYVADHYGYRAENVLTLNWGCEPATTRATHADPPRIVYFGSLGGPSLDLPLLARLTRLYPHIDVYGGPPPDPALGLNYRGYADASILARYQVGLITSRPDELRLYGFSAKHPQYLAYGLPVLVPNSRRFLELLRGSVPYDEESFLELVEQLADRDEWQRVSDEAYAQAQRLRWDLTLEPLAELLA